MATLFSLIDIETGDLTQFSSTATGTGYTLAASASALKNGSYGMRAVASSGSDTGNEARATKTFTDSSTNLTVIDAWMRFDAWTSGGYGGVIAKSILLARDSGIGQLFWLAVRGTRQVELCYQNTSFSNVASGLTLTMTLSTWYLIRIIHDASVPNYTFKHSSDGVSFTTIGSISTNVNSAKADEVSFGICHINQWEQAQYTVDVDDMIAYDAEPVAAGQPMAMRWQNIPHAGARIQRIGVN